MLREKKKKKRKKDKTKKGSHFPPGRMSFCFVWSAAGVLVYTPGILLLLLLLLLLLIMIIIIHCFYIPLFSALEQTHWADVARDSKRFF